LAVSPFHPAGMRAFRCLANGNPTEHGGEFFCPYHASPTTSLANHGDFFNTHACFRQLNRFESGASKNWGVVLLAVFTVVLGPVYGEHRVQPFDQD
jgi:hypothetical protein